MDSDDDDDLLAGAIVVQCTTLLLIVGLLRMQRRRNRRTRIGVHPINQRRDVAGHFNNLFVELREHPDRFFNYTRMTLRQFDDLHELVKEELTLDAKYSRPLPSDMRLAITLRYLATGDNFISIALAYRVGVDTCRKLVYHTCNVLWRKLYPIYLRPPSKEEYKVISQDFEKMWNLPHCLGAIDGKHIVIKCPPHSGSDYFCYKKHFSLVLMAVCDANYLFTLVDIGHMGSVSDGGVFRNSIFGDKIINNTLEVPEAEPLPGSVQALVTHEPTANSVPPYSEPFPYFFIGDEAFPLRKNIMRPYPRNQLAGHSAAAMSKKIFNYRLSRARRVIENTFGILAAKWRVFHTVIEAKPSNVISLVQACIGLHNYIIKTRINQAAGHVGDRVLDNGELTFGNWRDAAAGSRFQRVPIRSNRNPEPTEKFLRDQLANYLSTIGSVPWQVEMVNRGGF